MANPIGRSWLRSSSLLTIVLACVAKFIVISATNPELGLKVLDEVCDTSEQASRGQWVAGSSSSGSAEGAVFHPRSGCAFPSWPPSKEYLQSTLSGLTIYFVGDSQTSRVNVALLEVLSWRFGSYTLLREAHSRDPDRISKFYDLSPDGSDRPALMLNGEGPSGYGILHPRTTDCAICLSQHVYYSRIDLHVILHTMEYAKDTELFTAEYNYTQEVIFKSDAQRYPPDYVLWNTGVHDIKVATADQYETNLHWALDLMLESMPGTVVYWSSLPPKDPLGSEYQQSRDSVLEFNARAKRVFDQSSVGDRVLFLDLFDLGDGVIGTLKHTDNIHMEFEVYEMISHLLLGAIAQSRPSYGSRSYLHEPSMTSQGQALLKMLKPVATRVYIYYPDKPDAELVCQVPEGTLIEGFVRNFCFTHLMHVQACEELRVHLHQLRGYEPYLEETSALARKATLHSLLSWLVGHAAMKRTYLQIGKCSDSALQVVFQETSVATCVDPNDGHIRVTSDAFFAPGGAADAYAAWDVVFLNGNMNASQVKCQVCMTLQALDLTLCLPQVFRDVTNSLGRLTPNGAIVVCNCNPRFQSMTTEDWCGDAWWAISMLRFRADIDIAVGDFDYGCAVILRRPNSLRPTSRNPFANGPSLSWEYFDVHRLSSLHLLPGPKLLEWIVGTDTDTCNKEET
jgi:hypothetical protein